MRFLIVGLLAAAGLEGQAPLSGETALKKFKQKLESLTNAAGGPVQRTVTPGKTCAIPLLKVPATAQPVDPQMAIVPRNDVHFHIVQVIPPAPPCDEGNVSWKE
jgi:hypothetical protein